ncbi:ROK family protein [uncultured Dechloromonas sp.]|uniref:ROK family protein n=1 Tax=uncultured Dechloromonas sp. TaxID=171719 RepID=UPI0025E423C6|nr:ROK family protein [uncultured Dechloromonas sp.]
MSLRIGIDLGGTKIEIVALDEQGTELLRRRVDTPQGDYLGTVMAVAGLVEAAEDELGRRGSVGIGIPGAESLATGLIKNANSTCLIGKPLRRDLQALLQRELRLANDANCFALSEAIDGSGRDAEIVFGIILGTGVGGGIVMRQQVLVGANAIAGEWGHNPLPALPGDEHPPPACYCGRRACIEAYLSGPGLSADHARHTGIHLDAATIARDAEKGDAACEATLRRYEERLGRALAGVINILDPQVVVFGGGLSNMQRLYRNLPERCAPHVFSDTVRTRFLPPTHGDSSGVRGAAWLWS